MRLLFAVFDETGNVTHVETPVTAWRYEGESTLLVVPTTTDDPLALVLDEETGLTVERRVLEDVPVVPPVAPPVSVPVGIFGDHDGITARWRATLLSSAVGYVVSLNERDPSNPMLWTRQHGYDLPVTATSWRYRMLDEGKTAWVRVEIVDSAGIVLDLAVEGQITMPARAVRGSLSKWSQEFTLGTTWRAVGTGTPTVTKDTVSPFSLVKFPGADCAIQQVVPTYPQSGKEYDLYAVMRCNPADANRTVQVYAHDVASGGMVFSQLVTLTTTGTPVRIPRTAATSNGRWMRFGFGTYGGATIRDLFVSDFALLPKDAPYVVTQDRVWQQPMYLTGSNTVSTAVNRFSGYYESLDRSVPVVHMLTGNELEFEGMFTIGKGEHYQTADSGGNSNNASNARITIRKAYGKGLPSGVNKLATGWFLRTNGLKSLVMEDVYFGETGGGFKLADIRVTATDQLSFKRIFARNMDGRRSDGTPDGHILSAENSHEEGSNGFKSATASHGANRLIGASIVNLLNINNNGRPTSEIPNFTWDDVFLENWHGESRIEDSINLYQAGGTETQPMVFRRYCVWNALPWDYQSGRAGGTAANTVAMGPIVNIATDGSSPNYAGTGGLLSDGLQKVDWRQNPNYSSFEDTHALGPGAMLSIQGGAFHVIRKSEIISSGKTRDGRTVTGYQRSGIEISYQGSVYAKKDPATGVLLRDANGQMIPIDIPDSAQGGALRPIMQNNGAHDNLIIWDQAYMEAGAWSFNQGFTTAQCHPGFGAPGSLTYGNVAERRHATWQEEHASHRRWMQKVEDAGSSWGLR